MTTQDQAKSKVTLAEVSPDVMKDAASSLVSAVRRYEGSKLTLIDNVRDAVEDIGQPLTAQQYDKQLRPYLAEGFAKLVKSGKISQKTADQYASKLKTCVLALLCGIAAPLAGEGFFAFYDRASEVLTKALMPDGVTPVWATQGKEGRPKGAKAAKPATGAQPGAVTAANVAAGSAASQDTSGGNQGSPELAAARILARNNESRAKRLVAVLGAYAEEFDRWAKGILEASEKKSQPKGIKGNAPKVPETPKVETPAPIVLAADQPATALGQALVEAQAKVNVKAEAEAKAA